MINIKEPIIKKAAEDGSLKASNALSQLTKKSVSIINSKVQTVPASQISTFLKSSDENQLMVYAQLLSGVPGISLLAIAKNGALNLVDILNNRPLGSTSILKEIDRSALKETLNILSNSYMNSLSGPLGICLGLSVPKLVTQSRIEDIAQELNKGTSTQPQTAIVFETILKLSEIEIKVSLYLLFGYEILNQQPKGGEGQSVSSNQPGNP